MKPAIGPRKLGEDCAAAGPASALLRMTTEKQVKQRYMAYRGLPKTTVPALIEMGEFEELELRPLKYTAAPAPPPAAIPSSTHFQVLLPDFEVCISGTLVPGGAWTI